MNEENKEIKSKAYELYEKHGFIQFLSDCVQIKLPPESTLNILLLSQIYPVYSA